MKILRTTYLIKAGPFGVSPEWEVRHDQICKAIADVEWPVGSGDFTLHAKKHANGVVPIKKSCMNDLKTLGWSLETRFALSAVLVVQRFRTGQLGFLRGVAVSPLTNRHRTSANTYLAPSDWGCLFAACRV